MTQVWSFVLTSIATICLMATASSLPKQLSKENYATKAPGQKQKEIVLGYMSTVTHPALVELADGRKISGAMTVAVDTVNADPNILPNHKLTYVFGDDKANEKDALALMQEQREQGAVAFFGPEVTCEAAGRMAGVWNLPLMAYKCDDPMLSDKKEFPTLVRTQPPSSEYVRAILALVKHYHWTSFSLLLEQMEGFPKAALELCLQAHRQKLTVHHFVNISGPFNLLKDHIVLTDAIDRTYQDTQIYVVLGNLPLLQGVVQHLHDLGVTIAVIGIHNRTPYSQSMAVDILYQSSRFTPAKSNMTTAAFRNVFIVANPWATNPEYSRFQQLTGEALYKPPINFPKNRFLAMLGLRLHLPKTAANLYDAVLLYAHALHHILASGGQVTDGTRLTDKMKNMSFDSILGQHIYMDDKGDAEANYIVLALQREDNIYGAALKPVGEFQRDAANRKKLTFRSRSAVIKVDSK